MFSQQQSHENEHSQARNVRPYGVAGSSNTLSPTSSLSALPSWVTLAIFRQLQTIHLLSKKQKPEKQDGLHASGVPLALLPLHTKTTQLFTLLLRIVACFPTCWQARSRLNTVPQPNKPNVTKKKKRGKATYKLTSSSAPFSCLAFSERNPTMIVPH